MPIFFFRNSEDTLWVDLEPWVVPNISYTITNDQGCPNSIGGFVGQLPLCEGSFCPVGRTLQAMRLLWDTVGHVAHWGNVLDASPYLSLDLESALNWIMDIVDGWGLFDWVSYLKRRTIAKGIFVVNLNDFNDHGLPLVHQSVVTTFSCGPTPTTSGCPSVTVEYIYATPPYSEVIVSNWRLTLAIMS